MEQVLLQCAAASLQYFREMGHFIVAVLQQGKGLTVLLSNDHSATLVSNKNPIYHQDCTCWILLLCSSLLPVHNVQ